MSPSHSVWAFLGSCSLTVEVCFLTAPASWGSVIRGWATVQEHGGLSGWHVCLQAYSLQHSKEDRLAYLNHLPGGELTVQLLFVLYGVLALAFLSGYYVTLAAQILAVLLPPVMLLIDGNVAYWHNTRRVEFWNQMKLLGESVGIFGTAVILATDG